MQVKSGDIRTLASTSLILVQRNWPSEIRLHGFKLLQVCSHRASFFYPSSNMLHENFSITGIIFNMVNINIIIVEYLIIKVHSFFKGKLIVYFIISI